MKSIQQNVRFLMSNSFRKCPETNRMKNLRTFFINSSFVYEQQESDTAANNNMHAYHFNNQIYRHGQLCFVDQ
jgi:hypothetical protein